MAVSGAMLLWDVVMAIFGAIMATAQSEDQMSRQNARTARQTQVDNIYQAAQDIYGVSAQRLDQVMAEWDLKKSQLAEASRGSSRLSIASKILRDYTRKYPEARKQINEARNAILNESGRLSSRNKEADSTIQKGGNWANRIANMDVAKSNHYIGSELKDVTEPDGSALFSQGQIDTMLSDKPKSEGPSRTTDSSGKNYDWNGNGALEGWELQKGATPEGYSPEGFKPGTGEN